MRIAIAIATTGRSEILRQMLMRLEQQTEKPNDTLIVGVSATDAPQGVLPASARFVIAPRGSSNQRNRALDELRGTSDVIAFIDDDYVPARNFVAGIDRLMSENPEVVAATGQLLADGFRSAGIAFAEADLLIADFEARASATPELADETGTYGCNMIFRTAATVGLHFDENLPLYGWLEDTDFSAQVARRGRVVRTNFFTGVHLGAKSGRVSGRRLGYSQIANPLYLANKGTLARGRAMKMVVKNILANGARSLRPEPWIDRRGRLRGNLLALADIALRRSHPMRVVNL